MGPTNTGGRVLEIGEMAELAGVWAGESASVLPLAVQLEEVSEVLVGRDS
jgi:hypothetical protein